MKLTTLPDNDQKGGYQLGTHRVRGQERQVDRPGQDDESIAATRLSGGPIPGPHADGLPGNHGRGEVIERGQGPGAEGVRHGTGVRAERRRQRQGRRCERLRKAVAGGAKVTTVTGRVQGWSGRFPEVLRPGRKTAGPETDARRDQL